MQVLHETEEPSARVRARLLESFPGAAADLLVYGIALDSCDAELTLLGGEPSGLRGIIGQKPEAEERHKGRHAAFDDEQPAKTYVRS